MARAKVRPTPKERLPGLAAKGLTQSQAARELGVSRQRVSQLVAQLGLTFRPNVPPVPKQRMEELAKKGMTKTEAARELGISLERVSRFAARAGVSFAPAWSRPKPAATELGRIIQAARLACGHSYSSLGELSGLHKGHIKAIERGRVKRPRAGTLRALADCLAGRTTYEELERAAVPREQAVLEQRLEELAEKGLTRPEASNQLGVSRERVRRLAAKLDLPFAPFKRQPKPPATEFGRIVQRARLAAGYTFSRTAELSDLHRRHVMGLEGGRVRHPTVKTVRALADCLAGHTSYGELIRAALPSDQAALRERLEELAKEGVPLMESARELGVSRDRVGTLAAKLDLSFAPFRKKPKVPATEFGRIIQAARLAADYNYAEVAELSGLHRRHVMDLEMGRIRRPQEKTLRALADCLDGPASYEELVRAVDGEGHPVRRGARRGRRRSGQA